MNEPPRRGRPVAVVPAHVARAALELFEARGFDETSMEHVATAAGLSRRSLFNHFPTKADLVWYGLEPFAQAFGALLDSAPTREPLLATIERCQLAALLQLGEDLRSVRARTRIIYHHPELSSTGSAGFGMVRTALEHFFSRRLGGTPGQVPSFVLAATITAQMASAFDYWAVYTNDESPAETLRAATQALTDIAIDR